MKQENHPHASKKRPVTRIVSGGLALMTNGNEIFTAHTSGS
ncbi:hypothetical protein RSX31_12075 [Rossellomorea sp. YC4-1]|nr:hypothetical protein [Rossellomorea sp. YC4-1]